MRVTSFCVILVILYHYYVSCMGDFCVIFGLCLCYFVFFVMSVLFSCFFCCVILFDSCVITVLLLCHFCVISVLSPRYLVSLLSHFLVMMLFCVIPIFYYYLCIITMLSFIILLHYF